MAGTPTFQEPRGKLPRWVPAVVGVVLLLALGWFLYGAFTDVAGVPIKQDPPTVIDMLPPPPPPPPPPPEPQEKPPEPTEAPVPSPVPEPAAAKPDAPAPMQIDGPAQAGGDAFGLGSGSGGGMGAPGGSGTCITPPCGGGKGGGIAFSRLYGQSLSSALQRLIAKHERLSRLTFSAEFDLTVSPQGEIRLARMKRSSGRPDRDQMLQDLLQEARNLPRPPDVVARYPVSVVLRGRSPTG